MIRLATVFSGIGAIEHALNRMGVDNKIVFACDNGDVDILRKEYGSNNAYDVYKYNPDGLDKNLSNGEFFRKTTNNLVEHYDGKNNEIKHSAMSSFDQYVIKGKNFLDRYL